jgi:hypothetical protein
MKSLKQKSRDAQEAKRNFVGRLMRRAVGTPSVERSSTPTLSDAFV